MSKDNIKGKLNEVKGEIKQAVGRATDNQRLENEGTADKVKGKAQQVAGHAKEAVRDITR
ncbi:CsbD family protein [Niveispirillum sp. SYP-B3756]|uniref:CsbD family protein n=1 Tax=Niveispirillum sp. SYP-B3756 TaxID=2662178 RepID=UPI001292161A|nr:CsbD family protein [Niveispirillum sp. SYP-B3756]MQP66069.1 CsbD family protein [Niveispirillum sp. SYP-B3756]